jgi:hypothetical protein
MNLGKLLAAGKSIMNVRAELSYRSSKQIYLPKFGSAKNPFKHEAAQPAEEDGDSVAAPSSPIEVAKAAPAMSSAIATPLQPRPVRADSPKADVVDSHTATISQKLPALPAMREKKAGWLKFNPSAIFRVTPKAEAKFSDGSAKMPNPAMQPELSLDSVRVVHNDLSDVDVEVVPIKSRTKASESEPQSSKKPLDILGKRLFGAT